MVDSQKILSKVIDNIRNSYNKNLIIHIWNRIWTKVNITLNKIMNMKKKRVKFNNKVYKVTKYRMNNK